MIQHLASVHQALGSISGTHTHKKELNLKLLATIIKVGLNERLPQPQTICYVAMMTSLFFLDA